MDIGSSEVLLQDLSGAYRYIAGKISEDIAEARNSRTYNNPVIIAAVASSGIPLLQRIGQFLIHKDAASGREIKYDFVHWNSHFQDDNTLYYGVVNPSQFRDDIKMPEMREDIIAYPMPVKKLVKEADIQPGLRDYIANMVYVGVLAQLLGIDLQKIYVALDFHFKGKKKAIDSNFNIIQSAADWAKENLEKRDPYYVEPMNKTDGFIMAEGNLASALGAIFGGVQFVGWYPITPASSLAETMNEYLPRFRKDPDTGKQTYVVVQAEDELAAIGMAIGAGFAGLRSMSSTSGPGMSLMSEYLGLAYYSEVPVVVVNVQRVGPSTGLPTRTAQADITQAYFHSHGDKNFILLLPGSVTECFEFGWKAFDIAERLQTPVIILTDLDLGMNNWMTKEFEYPDQAMDRGKVLWEEDLEKILLERNGDWGRYLDIDEDGIPYRTLPGNRHPRSAYFARGTGHDPYGRYSEEPDIWEKGLARLEKKINNARTLCPQPEVSLAGSKIGVLSFGSADPAVGEARDILATSNIITDYLRLKAVPFSPLVREFLADHEVVYVVELNRDGQMKQLLSIEYPELAGRLVAVCHTDGLPLTAKWVAGRISELEAK